MLNVGAVTGPAYNPTIIRDIAKNYVCQRRRKDVEEEFKTTGSVESPFPERDQKEVYVTLNDYEKRAIRKVEELGRHILDTAGPERTFQMRLAKWTVTHFHKRALSSPRSLVISLQNRLQVINQKLAKGFQVPREERNLLSERTRQEPQSSTTILERDCPRRIPVIDLNEEFQSIPAALRRERELIEDALVEAKKISGSGRET